MIFTFKDTFQIDIVHRNENKKFKDRNILSIFSKYSHLNNLWEKMYEMNVEGQGFYFFPFIRYIKMSIDDFKELGNDSFNNCKEDEI